MPFGKIKRETKKKNSEEFRITCSISNIRLD